MAPTLNVPAKTNDTIISNEAPNPGKPKNKSRAPSIVENISQSNKKLKDDKGNISGINYNVDLDEFTHDILR